MVSPHTPVDAPEILPGVSGAIDDMVLHLGAVCIPQFDVAYTQIFPVTKPAPTFTVKLGVPWPLTILMLAGTLQV